ncbi:MAG: M20/M25/M40 family metallo-hydrolase [Planctomycetota bacterium]
MPRTITFLFSIIAFTAAFAPSVLRNEKKPDAADLEAAKQILADELKRDLTFLASDELEGRLTGSPGEKKAAEYLAKRFEELKLDKSGEKKSYLQQVDAGRLDHNKKEGEPKTEIYNVIGVIKGTDPDAKAIVFSAHYDHIGRGKPNKEGDDINNGADDDGSGTVAVLALAKAYKSRAKAPKHTLVFACFTGEEMGGFGSKGYVTNPAVPLEKTLCNINLEMLGRSHGIGKNKAWVTGWEYSTLGPILAIGGKAAGVEIYQDPYPEQRYYMRSDNVAFILKGIIGQTVSAGSTHEDYHTPNDEVDKIEFDNMEKLVRGVYLGSSLIASGAETPKPTGDSLLPPKKAKK